MDTFSDSRLLSPRALSAYLDIPRHELRAWRRGGYGPPWIRIGGRVRYDRRDVDRWLRRLRRERRRALRLPSFRVELAVDPAVLIVALAATDAGLPSLVLLVPFVVLVAVAGADRPALDLLRSVSPPRGRPS